jgi:hypothetical protein
MKTLSMTADPNMAGQRTLIPKKAKSKMMRRHGSSTKLLIHQNMKKSRENRTLPNTEKKMNLLGLHSLLPRVLAAAKD